MKEWYLIEFTEGFWRMVPPEPSLEGYVRVTVLGENGHQMGLIGKGIPG